MRRSQDAGVTLDRDRVDVAVDHEAVEGRRVADDDCVGLVDPALDDLAVGDRGELVADAELDAFRRGAASGARCAARRAASPAADRRRRAGGPSERAPQCASTCSTSRSPSPYSVSS